MKNKVTNRKHITHNTGVARTREDVSTLATLLKCPTIAIFQKDMRKQNLTRITNHAEVSEKSIERYLVEKAKEHGLPCLKYSNPNMAGYPDRLLVLPGAKVVWVELKSKGCKPDMRQQIRHQELSRMGHEVRVIDNKADIDKLMISLI
jgi:hypothetical protein